jgi:protease IV
VRYTRINLAGKYREGAPAVSSPLTGFAGTVFRFDRFYLQVKSLIASSRVQRVLVVAEPSFTTAFVAGLESIGDLLGQLVGAGKEVWFHATDYSDAQLFLASRCTHRVIHPLGSIRCVGLFQTAYFFKRAMDRYGIEVRVARRGRYKSASDRFRLETLDPFNREQYEAWMQTGATTLHESILTGYGRPQADLDRLLEGSVLDSESSRSAGWVDSVATLADLAEEWQKEHVRQQTIRVPRRSGRGKTVAVLVIEGSIKRGKSSFNPVFGSSVGSDSVVKSIRALQKSKSIAAVVLRINSGGGDAVASEDIRSALTRLAGTKPLIVSMSEVAGSGGYWIATAGRSIFAARSTLTGSIGVIALSAAFGAPLNQFGVTHANIATHKHADAQSGMRPLSDDEFAQLDGQVESIYQRFLGLVSETRGQDMATVRDHAEGRVWSGLDASHIGLVDELGGIDEAIHKAKDEAGLTRARVAFYPRVRRSFVQRLLIRPATELALNTTTLPSIETIREFLGTPLLMLPESLLPLLSTNVIGAPFRDFHLRQSDLFHADL